MTTPSISMDLKKAHFFVRQGQEYDALRAAKRAMLFTAPHDMPGSPLYLAETLNREGQNPPRSKR